MGVWKRTNARTDTDRYTDIDRYTDTNKYTYNDRYADRDIYTDRDRYTDTRTVCVYPCPIRCLCACTFNFCCARIFLLSAITFSLDVARLAVNRVGLDVSSFSAS